MNMHAPGKFLAVAFVFTASLGGCTTTSMPAQDAAVRLRQQADAWDRAIVRKDVMAIAQNMAESFRQIDSQGNLSNKAEFLTGITSDKLVIQPYEPEDVEIRFYGNLALVTGTTHLHGTYDGKPFKTHYRYTDTYVNESGAWQVVNVQTTEIRE
ncbi:MAG: nuclear transport factor 2 family protein [Luteimonas sp.]